MVTRDQARTNLRRLVVVVGSIVGAAVGLYFSWRNEPLSGMFGGAIGGAIVVRIVWYFADAEEVW